MYSRLIDSLLNWVQLKTFYYRKVVFNFTLKLYNKGNKVDLVMVIKRKQLNIVFFVILTSCVAHTKFLNYLWCEFKQMIHLNSQINTFYWS